MDTIKAANKVIKDGIALLPDEVKGDFKAQASDIFIDEAISNALGAIHGRKESSDNADLYNERLAMLGAYAVQEANRVASTLWRLNLITQEYEAAYRALPQMNEMAEKYNEFTAARKAQMDDIMGKHKFIVDEEKEL